MTDERLEEIRVKLPHALGYTTLSQVAVELLAEVDRLKALIESHILITPELYEDWKRRTCTCDHYSYDQPPHSHHPGCALSLTE